MPVRVDPEATETRVLREFTGSLAGRRVLEVGCGYGRLTWRYAEHAGYIFAFDPDPVRVARAAAAQPAWPRATRLTSSAPGSIFPGMNSRRRSPQRPGTRPLPGERMSSTFTGRSSRPISSTAI
jgi:SAM-dependent methyltransferase